MLKDEYYGFTDMLKYTKISRSTLYRRIKEGAIKVKEVGSIKLYSSKDVINNKPKKK